MEYEFLKSLVIVFGASAVVVFLLRKFKIPSLVGFIIAGVIIGHYELGIVKEHIPSRYSLKSALYSSSLPSESSFRWQSFLQRFLRGEE